MRARALAAPVGSRRRRLSAAAGSFSLAAAFCGVEAMAQEMRGGGSDAAAAAATAPTDGVIAYPPSFFAEFRPSTAQDMVNRIPGFSFSRGDEVRGFAGAAGNVLIDGERPSSKTISLDEALRRIQPAQVERIDLIRGGAPGIDMQGQAVVANVIRKPGADTTLTAEFMGKFYNDHGPGAAPRLDGSTRIGDVLLTGAISGRVEKQQGDSGEGNFYRRNGRGELIARGPFQAKVDNRSVAANGALEYGDLRLNFGADRAETPRTEMADLTTAAGTRVVEKTVNDLVTDKAEIGGDYQQALGLGLTARLIGLYTARSSDFVSNQTGANAPRRSTKATEGSEAIVRGTLRGVFFGATLETGGEVALNTLDVASTLTSGGVPIVLPSANIRVEEERAEVFVSGARRLTERLSADAALRIETSTISQSGDLAQEKTLTFAKPRLALAFAPNAASQWRMRVERTVGQLNFEDFAASGDLSTGSVNAGNSDLEPERAWVAEAAWEQRFWDKGALVVTYTHSAVESVVDVIPIVSGASVFDAPGNLGDGLKQELAATFSLPLDRLGLRGFDLRGNYTWRRTRVTDPTTGEERPFSNLSPWEGQFTLTKDLPSIRSTFVITTMQIGNKARQYRSNEVRLDYTTPNYINVQFNWRPSPDFQLMVQVFENVFSRERRRERTIYSGSRALGVVALTEERSAEMEPFIMFRVRKTL